ncbi:unnamed protein product [Rhizophagus irregularis]|nr:unnamed protein product [Rhizophagus irregularis]
MTENALTKPPFNFGYGKITNLLVLINNLNNQRLLTLEEALSCVPPSASFKKLSKSIPTSGDHVPDDVFLWDDFLENVRMYEFTDEKRYQRPQFSHSKSGVGEMSAQAIFEFNICEVLNELLPDYLFSRKNTKNPGDPDFTCFFAQSTLLFPIEIKPGDLLKIGKLQFPEYYRQKAEARALWILETLELTSEFPTVLKAYEKR